MRNLRFVLCVAVLSAVVGGVTGAATVQWYSIYLGTRVHAGVDIPAQTAAQVQAIDREGGMAVASLDPAGENYYAGFSRMYQGDAFLKSMSISTMVGRRDSTDGWFFTRYNVTYLDGARQRDDVYMLACGGHGTVWNPQTPWKADECPGRGVFLANGTVEIRGALVVNGRVIQ